MMKKHIVRAAGAVLALAGLASCSRDGSVYALMNIPFEAFFAAEADSYDVLTGATAKAANGSLAYGTYHEKAEAVEGTVPAGITYPVQVRRSVLRGAGCTPVDGGGAYDITTTSKNGSATLRYTGQQRLFQSGSYSYCILKEPPAHYKPAELAAGGITFGGIAGTAESLGTLYVAAKADPKHTKGCEYVLFTDAGRTPLRFADAAAALGVQGDGSTFATPLNTVRAVIATADDGGRYGLTVLRNVWGGREFGVGRDSPLMGKSVTALTFITENGLYTATSFVLGTAAKVDGASVITFADDAAPAGSFQVAAP